MFLDVCVQRDLAPGGAWPLTTAEEMAGIATLFAIARELEIRQGGIVCKHSSASSDVPAHCRTATSGCERPPGCVPRLPVQVCEEGASADALDRRYALYLPSGCGEAPDAVPYAARTFDRMLAGIRDVVLFGAGIEYGMDRVAGALLRRRVRTHVVLDAAGAGDGAASQLIIAQWKRRAIDGATVETIRRLLARN